MRFVTTYGEVAANARLFRELLVRDPARLRGVANRYTRGWYIVSVDEHQVAVPRRWLAQFEPLEDIGRDEHSYSVHRGVTVLAKWFVEAPLDNHVAVIAASVPDRSFNARARAYVERAPAIATEATERDIALTSAIMLLVGQLSDGARRRLRTML